MSNERETNMMGNALWQLIIQSDSMSQGVMFLLLVMSIACWTIFLYKIILFRIKMKQLYQALHTIQTLDSFDQLLTLSTKFKGTIPGYFLAKNLHFLKSMLAKESCRSLQEHEYTLLEQHLDQTIDELVRTQETYNVFLSTSAAVAPLLGLFGTVWGLVHAFIRISEQQTADIATVAPGIAEALITTLAGLMVAIPALVMFNLLSSYLRQLEHKLISLADFFATHTRITFREQLSK
jgi:biopolymer transport protein TolQ